MKNNIRVFFTKSVFAMTLALGFAACASKQPIQTPQPNGVVGFDAELTNYKYPFEVKTYEFEAQRLKLKMAYMELAAKTADAPVIVLLHGKNYSGFYFAGVATRLNEMGYRVIMPDQIGFGKSTKPTDFQYSFQALGGFTDALLTKLGVTKYTLLGHSMGGMLAARMALMYPEKIQKLVLVNPIGLEDWKTMTAYRPLDQAYESELKATPESIKKYQSDSYFEGAWKPEYDYLIEVGSGWTKNPDFPLVAWNSALTADMIFTQPVVYEFKDIKVPTFLIVGQRDKTAIGRAWAKEPMKSKMGNYPVLGRQAAKAIPKSKLYELKGLGHVPFIEDQELFFKSALVPALK